MVVVLFAKGGKNSLEKIQQSDTVRYDCANSDTVFQHGALSQKVKHCQTNGSSNSFDTVPYCVLC